MSIIVNDSIKEQVSLKPYNTLGIDVKARFFLIVSTLAGLQLAREFCTTKQLPWLILGGGSNVVFTENFDGLVVLMAIKGRIIQTLDANNASDHAKVEVGAGENWDALVAYTLAQGLYGLENLSLIPGSVGAAPIQNVGAYGVELASVLSHVKVFDFETGQCFILTQAECQLGYRDSIFKRQPHWVITYVTLQLRHQAHVQVAYTGLSEQLAARFNKAQAFITPLEVRQAVVSIRQQKLPNPDKVPNVGSFFKNPIVTPEYALKLQQQYPRLVSYKAKDHLGQEKVKLAAGWLIDTLGWKGFQDKKGVGVHDKQALVLVNHGNASGDALLQLANKIQQDVKAHFGVSLEIEPRVYGRLENH